VLQRATFPPEPASALSARLVAERTLEASGLDELLETTRLLVSELVINAVLHAGTDVELVMSTGSGRLRVEVSDHSESSPQMRRSLPSAPSGRGLLIVDRLADDWGVERRPGGKTVWFELQLAGAAGREAAHAGRRAGRAPGRQR